MHLHPGTVVAFAAIAAISLCQPALAQTKTETSPPGQKTTEGSHWASTMFAYSSARYQYADGNFKGKGRKVMKQVGYRHNWIKYAASVGTGRKWSRVQIMMAEGNYDTMVDTFSKNASGKQTKVFDKAVSLPTQIGFPSKSAPAPFIAGLAFPFSSKWAYSGNADMLIEFVFAGGAMSNSVSWPAGQSIPYYLDARYNAAFRDGIRRAYGSTLCRDSANTLSYQQAYTYPILRSYAQVSESSRTSNKLQGYTQSVHCAFNKPVIHALAVAGSTTPTILPAAVAPCNQLFVNMNLPVFLFPGVSDSRGGFNTSSQIPLVPFSSTLVGATVWAQGAFHDSKTSGFKITKAGRSSVTVQPSNPTRNKCLYHRDVNSKVGEIGWRTDHWYNPLVLYTYE